MTISSNQFCTNLIKEFFKPSGPTTIKTQTRDEINRPLVNATIINNFRINDIGKIEIELEGLQIKPSKNLFRQDCFDFNCFEEEGITTNIKSISSICLVNPGNNQPNKFLTKKQRLDNNLTCFVDSNNNESYFIRGSIDEEGYVYFAQIGTVNMKSGTLSIIEQNVPFYSSSKSNSLFALSQKQIGKGVKFALIKRASKTTLEDVGIVYGQLEEEFYLPHNSLKSNRSFVAQDQTINLENLSLNLLLLSNFNQYELKDNQIIYRNQNFSSPLIETVLNQSVTRLINLILTEEGLQQGSIPLNLASYSSSEEEYNSSANLNYINKITTCFQPNCFDPECFETITNNNLIKRDIDNRSIAWVIMYLCSHLINYNLDINIEIKQLINYLLNQKDKTTKLYFKGWAQKEFLYNKEELLDENNEEIVSEDLNLLYSEPEILLNPEVNNYTEALEKDTSILTSTNISIFFALLKLFEVTQDITYLIEADTLYNAIKKYLINNLNLYKHSLIENNASVESTTYQLMLSLTLDEYDNINEIIEFFKLRLNSVPQQSNEEVFVGNDLVLVNTSIVETAPLDILNSDDDLNLFTNTSFDNISSIEDIFKYNYLIYSNLNLLNEKIYLPFLDEIKIKYKIIQNKVEADRNNSALIFAIGYLINNNTILKLENSKFKCIKEFNNYRFQKTAALNNLLINTPKDYGWFNTNALNQDSNIRDIYNSISKVLAKNATGYSSINNKISIDDMYGITLNKKALDYNLFRFNKEDDISFRARIKLEIFNRGITKLSLENKLNIYNSPINILDNYKPILSFESNNAGLFNTNWGEGYFQGGELYNTNIITINSLQPIEPDVYLEIEKLRPAGIKVIINEVLTFSINNSSSVINITDITDGCPHLRLETTNDLLSESSTNFCMEDTTLLTNCLNIGLENGDELLTETSDLICIEGD